MKNAVHTDAYFFRDLAPLGAGEGDFFDATPVFRVFLIEGDRLRLPGILGWIDMWYSGMISRVLSSFYQSKKPLPASLLFLPENPPLQKGFLIVRRKSLEGDPVGKLSGLLAEMGLEKAVLDGTLLIHDVLPETPVPETPVADLNRKSLLFLSDPNSLPSSCILRET